MTKRLLWWRGILLGLATFLTLLPLSIRFDNDRITWSFLHEMPPQAAVLICLGALTCWSGYLYVRRRLRCTGL